MSDDKAATYVLPSSLVGHADFARLGRAVEALEANLQAQRVRDPAAQLQLPVLSQLLADFVEQNKLDLNDPHTFEGLKANLRHIQDHAPNVHMTFASEPDPYLLQKIIIWLRTEIHPNALLNVGLQPSLVGGVYLRTPNRVHDFSVKALLKDKRNIIVEELERLHAG